MLQSRSREKQSALRTAPLRVVLRSLQDLGQLLWDLTTVIDRSSAVDLRGKDLRLSLLFSFLHVLIILETDNFQGQ